MTASEYASNIKKRAGVSHSGAIAICNAGITSDKELAERVGSRELFLNHHRFGFKAQETLMEFFHLNNFNNDYFDLATKIFNEKIKFTSDFRKIHCIYFLYQSSKLLYIGSSVNLVKRLGEHIQFGKVFDSVFFYELPKEYTLKQRLAAEYSVIFNCKPYLNKQLKPHLHIKYGNQRKT